MHENILQTSVLSSFQTVSYFWIILLNRILHYKAEYIVSSFAHHPLPSSDSVQLKFPQHTRPEPVAVIAEGGLAILEVERLQRGPDTQPKNARCKNSNFPFRRLS